jgi:hypothetical protein
VLVFVASRRQTRLTGMDLISHAAADERPTQFLNMDPNELQVSLGVLCCAEGRCGDVHVMLGCAVLCQVLRMHGNVSTGTCT